MMWEAVGSVSAGGGRRKPSWRERENNRRRERRRRAIAAKIYMGLRAHGNFDLPKHCDNNEVLKALCSEAGWVVEPDGTTYRKGSKPCPMEIDGTSAYNLTPSSTRRDAPNPPTHPFAFLLNSIPSSSLPALRISSSAPATPPLPSPTREQQQQHTLYLETLARESISGLNIPFFASAPASPARGPRFRPMTIPEGDESDTSTIDLGQWMNFPAHTRSGFPRSPTFSLVRPVARVKDADKGKGLESGYEDEGAVKAWEGERIHDVGMDDLELTLGGSGNAR